MRCIIAGDRHLTSQDVFDAAIGACPFVDEISIVVSGMARGADTLGVQWARARGIPVDPHPAAWTVAGRYDAGAGKRRNAAMAAVAEALIAIPGAGNGTRDMIKRARRAGLRVFVYERGVVNAA